MTDEIEPDDGVEEGLPSARDAFKRVFLPEGRELNARASQTFLRHYNQCPRSGYLYALYKGEASTPEMLRGSALHLAAERMSRVMLEQDEKSCPPELVKAIVAETLLEYAVPIEEHDYLYEMAYRLGSEWRIEDPSAVVAVETLFVLDIAGWEVRCKIDFAEMGNGGEQLFVKDYKSARAAVPYEDISRKRSDGTFAAKSFQLILYALAIVYGVPVREEMHMGERREVREPFPVGARAGEVFLDYVYPGIERKDGSMLQRGVSLTRGELDVYKQSLEALLHRLRASEQTGRWPAITSDAACSECPSQHACPIPTDLRDYQGRINTAAEAAVALQRADRTKAMNAALRREVKAFAKHHGIEIRWGADKVAKFVTSEAEKVVDRDGMFDAVRRAAMYGEDFDESEFVQTVVSTSFSDVKLSEDELVAEAAKKEDADGSQ